MYEIYDKKDNNIECDREENIFGSGSTNYRKFFKPALKLLKKNDFEAIYDLGCGNGFFLDLTQFKKIKLGFSKIVNGLRYFVNQFMILRVLSL
jgi:hypothetical protein